jgi:hypothetical protein
MCNEAITAPTMNIRGFPEMRSIRFTAPGAALLGLTIILAACGQAVAHPASPTPAPTAAPTPTDAPPTEPTVAPTPGESASPTPAPIEVIEHELPMIARSTADGVEVHTLPSADAPLLMGERFPDMSWIEIRLEADELVAVSLGPVYVDGTSWYQVSATDGGSRAYAYGWAPAEVLVREGDAPASGPQAVGVHGLGNGTAVNATIAHGTPLTVDVAAAPMPDRDSCEIEVTLVRTDGLGVNVATESLTGPYAFQLSANELSSLFMEEAGTATLQIKTNCSYAASLTYPPY